MDLTPILLQYLSSEETYSMTKDIKLRVLYGDKQHIKNVLQTLSKLISKDQQPIVRLLALRLNKELAETFHEEYIHLMQKIILPKMEEILIANQKIYEEDKGKSLFLIDQKPNQNIKELQFMGEQFYRVALECIWIWAKWFPLDKIGQKLSVYRVTMEKLVKLGIKFPKIQYFNLDNVYRNLPQSLPPLPMIIQLRELLKDSINLPTKQLCHHLTMNHSLLIFDSKYHTYGEMLQKLVLHSALVRTKKSKITSIILDEKNAYQAKVNIIDDNFEGKLDAMLIEKQQLENMNNCYQQRNMELQKQLISSQNQCVIQAKEIQIQNNLILQSQAETATLLIKFNQLVEQYEKYQKVNHTPYINAQLEHELVAFRNQYEFIQSDFEIKKLQQENILLTEKKSECEDQIDKLQREKQQLSEENILLQKKEMQLMKKKYQGSTTSIPPKNGQSNSDSILQINQLKSQLVQYQQQIIQLKAQISLLKDHITKFDKKHSSTFGSSTQSQINYENRSLVIGSALQNSQQKNLKPIQNSNLIEYNPTIFSIHPNAFNLKFRQACLNSKAILYNDEIIQIGVQTMLKQNLLQITLGIQNKSNIDLQQLELKLSSIPELQIFQYNELSSIIKPKEQALVKLQVQILKPTYQLPEFKLKFKYQQQDNVIDLCLPCTINKFFNFQPLPDQLPSIYFYSGPKFPTGFQNQFEQLLPEFSIRKINETEIEAMGRVDIEKKQLIVLIQSKRSVMQIRITGEYQDKLAETIMSTYQGLFIKR